MLLRNTSLNREKKSKERETRIAWRYYWKYERRWTWASAVVSRRNRVKNSSQHYPITSSNNYKKRLCIAHCHEYYKIVWYMYVVYHMLENLVFCLNHEWSSLRYRYSCSSCLPWVADRRDIRGPIGTPVLCVVSLLLITESRVLHGLLDLQLLGAGVDPTRWLLVLVVPKNRYYIVICPKLSSAGMVPLFQPKNR